ncbi:MAG: helix-turn-helix domain-containing protein [Clostridium fessum]
MIYSSQTYWLHQPISASRECCRIFQNILHTTPYGYLTNYRIQTSVSLLHRDLPISQIAGLVGYNQVSNYIATFKRIIGCTPAQYRKQHLSKPDIPSS